MSKTGKRILWAGIGAAFAVIYGWWTMLVTGGGHVNFIWFGLFIFVDGFGLYFPLMAFLAVDLRSLYSKIVFGSLICFNVVGSIVMIYQWVSGPGIYGSLDFDKAIHLQGIEFILLCAAAHFLPTLVFMALLIKAIIRPDKSLDDGATLTLDLS